MNKALDDGLVALLLLASLAYALSTLGPKGWRRRLWSSLARLAARAPAGLRLGGLARRLDRSAADKGAGACGGCDTCGDAGEDTEAPAEFRVPLTKIGRRQ